MRDLVILLIVGVVCLVVGYFLHPDPPPVVRTEIEYRDRPIADRDTSGARPPDTRIIYRDSLVRAAPETLFVPVPRGFRSGGILIPNPVRVDGRRVTLTYWQPDSLAYIQDVFITRAPRWAWSLNALGGAAWDERGRIPYLGVQLRGRWQRLTVSAAPTVSLNGHAQIDGRLTWRFLGAD